MSEGLIHPPTPEAPRGPARAGADAPADPAPPSPRGNRLAAEASPYLRQHATNPVDWYPWGEEALARSRREEKPIFLSIGYSACHWCHVMERESFQDEAIAAYLNERFVCIKVDREERPDLDEIYMKAVQMLCGSGGWPMSVFLTPDLKPFYGGTYFPPSDRWGRPGFRTVIEAIAHKWEDGRGEIEHASSEMTRRIRKLATETGEPRELDASILDEAASQLADEFDPVYGGFGDAPKFPHPMELSLLLRRHVRTGEERLRQVVEFTCERMARGGLYDQLGGGFHRYSTDDRWLVPHFEKMLYDNALLVRLFLEVHQVTGRELFSRVAGEVLDYVLREMTSPEGAFYATQDADSGDEEGAYFVWTPAEVREAVGGDEDLAGLLCRHYGITPEGNFEGGKTVLSIADDQVARAAEAREAAIHGVPGEGHGTRGRRGRGPRGRPGGRRGASSHGAAPPDPDRVAARIAEGRRRMLEARAKRVKPARDEKILAEWNGLMISALAQGGVVLGESRWIEAARRAADHVLRAMRAEDGALLRTPPAGERRLPGTLADYGALANGLLDLYEATFDTKYLREGGSLAREMMRRFRDEDGEGFFVTEEGRKDLLVRSKDPHDGATPSGNSLAVRLLLRLAAWTGNPGYLDPALRTLAVHAESMRKLPAAFGELLCVLDTHLAGAIQVVLAGDPADERFQALKHAATRSFLPERVLARGFADPEVTPPPELTSLLEGKGPHGDAPAAYVCRDSSCRQAVTSAKALARELERVAAEGCRPGARGKDPGDLGQGERSAGA